MNVKKLIRNFLTYRPIKDAGQSRHSRKVLLSYITSPFIHGNSLRHNNYQESLAIASVFDEMGYSVDVLHYLDKRKPDYSQYDIIFGFGEPLINSFYQSTSHPIRIYYGTGCHIHHQNSATLNRLREVFQKTGRWMMSSGRIVKDSWSEQTTLVDAMVVLGNKFVLDTYRQNFHKSKNIYNQPVSCIKSQFTNAIIKSRDIEDSKNHFLWFGSSGAIHKGLDLLLEVFAKRPGKHLHICGSLKRETEFFAHYKTYLNLPNIHYHGFVAIDSLKFVEIIKKCLFTIFPSCSEGQPGSVINVMSCGLIPIVPETSGINNAPYVFNLRNLSILEINKALDAVEKISNARLSKLSQNCSVEISRQHSLEMYKKNLRKNLSKIIQSI